MSGHVAVQNLPPTMLDDHEAVQQVEGQGGYSKKVECDNRLAMIGKKCLPALIRSTSAGPQASQIPGDRAFGDRKAELQQLAVDLRRSPAGVLKAHLANQTADLVCDPRSAAPPPGCQRQYSRKPLRCHAITVAGSTMARTSDHRGHTLRSRIQKSRSSRLRTGRRRFRFNTTSCWRRASTSNERSRRLRKKTAKAATIAPIISITHQL